MAGPYPRDIPMIATPEKCSGRTFIVTGANTGLGKEAAKHLVAQGAAKVIMAVRNISAGNNAKQEIESTTSRVNIAEVWNLDLSNFDSVKAFAKRASAELDRVDGLIENAGVFMFERVLVEGHTLPVTVNVIGTFLLGILMLPKMSDTAKRFPGATPHLAVVGSSMGYQSKEAWNTIKDDPIAKLDGWTENVYGTYALTKLMDIMCALELSSIVPVSRTGVTVNVLCPGLCTTELDRHVADDQFRKNLNGLYEKFGRTPEEGSRTLVHAALGGVETHGQYLDSCKVASDKIPDWVTDAEGRKSQKLLWDVVAAEIEKVAPGSVQAAVAASV